MDVAFRPLDPASDDDVRAVVRWSNDAAIRHLHVWCKDEAAYRERDTVEAARDRLAAAVRRGKWIDMIVAAGALVGEVSYDLDPEPLHSKIPGTAWFGLVVGEAAARGKGVGTAAMLHIEAAAREAGCTRAEIGVFAFNERAQRLYARLGYAAFARIPAFQWWDGKLWDDLRLEKTL